MSDAVDQAVSQIDFSSLSDRKVYLDTTYLTQVAPIGFVNANYIIGSIRQQMTASQCLLQDSKGEADVIVEARVGTLGTDGHEITYGLPQSTALSTAATYFTNAPAVPVIPELSIGRSDAQSAVAKVVLFAYDRETRQPIWQSGIAKAESNNQNTWFLGAGPFQKGTIYEGVRFAGSRFDKKSNRPVESTDTKFSYFKSHNFEANKHREIDGAPLEPALVAEKPEEPGEEKTIQ